MSFRNKESQLIWENYMNPRPKAPEDMSNPSLEDPMYDDGMEYGDEDAEATVISLEPMVDLETEVEHDDNQDLSIYSELKMLADYSKKILDLYKNTELEPWMEAKLVKASSYVCDVWSMLDAKADFANGSHGVDDGLGY